MKGNVKGFVTEAFDYYAELENVSIDHSINRYLLEHIANGFVKYGSVDNYINHIDDWIRSLIKVFPELGFDHENHQINAIIDLVDQVVVVDQFLYDQLSYVINVQSKYGLLITYNQKGGEKITTTLSRFFEVIQKMYPQIKDRYKGLGSSDPSVMREVVTDPKTRRIYQITMDDIQRTKEQMGILVGKSREEVMKRKQLLLDFKFTVADIDT